MILFPIRVWNTLPPARIFYNESQEIRVAHTDAGGLLEKEAVLFHPRNGIEIGKPDLPIIKYPAVKAGKIIHVENFEYLFRLCLDLFYGFQVESGGIMVFDLVGRQILFAEVEDPAPAMNPMCHFYFGSHQGHRKAEFILEDYHGEFPAPGHLFEHYPGIHPLREYQFRFFESFFGRIYRECAYTRASGRRLRDGLFYLVLFEKGPAC